MDTRTREEILEYTMEQLGKTFLKSMKGVGDEYIYTYEPFAGSGIIRNKVIEASSQELADFYFLMLVSDEVI